MQDTSQQRASWLDRPIFSNLALNWETLLFALIFVLGIVTRFYDLEPRVMSHDENSHVYYSWRLSRGEGYQHTPLTHGPLLFHLTAFSFFLFGDNDLTARIPFVLFGVATIGFVWFFRRYLGRAGTLITAALVLISPFMLYYARYARNEAFIGLFGLVTIWAILRYLETGEAKYAYWLTAATVLHFTAKETSFIYTAQALLFLGLLFVYQLSRRPWESRSYRAGFWAALLIAALLLAGAVGLSAFSGDTPAPVVEEGAAAPPAGLPSNIPFFPLLMSAVAVLLALYFAIRGLGWQTLKNDRVFSLMILLFTLVLPHLAAFPVNMMGWSATDYSSEGMVRTAIFLIPLGLIAIAIGLLWNPNLWLVNAAIFYIPYTLLYTTLFTNGQGFFTGLVGSLGYWLEQQGVERGSQPWYYYLFLQIPVYEFLPALGSVLALYYGLRRGRPAIPQADPDQPAPESVTEIESYPVGERLFLALAGFWAITSALAFTVAGEKMPWLTFHIALPMILLTGWALGQLVERIDWEAVKTRRGWLLFSLMLVFLISFAAAVGSLSGTNRPFQGKELTQLNATSAFITSLLVAVASGWGIALLLKEWDLAVLRRMAALVIFGLLGLLTARAAFRAAYINYDNPTEYLVYAHSATGVKEALAQIEELSQRTSNGLAMTVAYDDECTYPYWWYLRNYSNQKFYGANPTRELRDAPVILVGDNNFAKIEPVVGNGYYQFDYSRIWWPNQDYYNITWERLKNALTNPELRAALWQIWFNRDYSKYAQVTGKTDLTLPTWAPSDRMRLYVRKDIANQVWNLGAAPEVDAEFFVDPYEGKSIPLAADLILGAQGNAEGQFQTPRSLAVAPDGSLYVVDTGNHRIQHLSPDGEVLHVWGSFADNSQTEGGAPPGAFYDPWGIAVGPDGSVYVADTWNYRIQKFTADGQFLTQWSAYGTGETASTFWGPRDIKVDAQGRVYDSDTGNKRVVIFDENGGYLAQFGGAGLLPGQLDEPVGLTLDSEGNVYVADTWNQRIQVFESSAGGLIFNPLREWEIVGWYGQSTENKPYLAWSSSGRLFASDPEGYRILEFDANGQFVQYWGVYGSGADGMILPTGLAIDAEGQGLWVADTGNHRLLHFSLPPITADTP